jgi:hypothetical protein
VKSCDHDAFGSRTYGQFPFPLPNRLLSGGCVRRGSHLEPLLQLDLTGVAEIEGVLSMNCLVIESQFADSCLSFFLSDDTLSS